MKICIERKIYFTVATTQKTTKKIKKLRLSNFVKVIGLSNCQDLYIENGIIRLKEDIKQIHDFNLINAEDCVISPGFVDVQVNGYKDCNFCGSKLPTFSQIDSLRHELALHGIVAFCPTIITAPQEKIIETVKHINSYLKQTSESLGSRILGIHIEGIFITKFGVHESTYVKKDLTVKEIEPFIKDNVMIFTLAPELDKTGEAIKYLKKNNILVSIGHSNATYKEGQVAIKNHYLNTVTHMFNALRGVSGFSHRPNESGNIEVLNAKLEDESKIKPNEDGIILALLNSKEVLCMTIADGIHVDKEVVTLLRKYKDNEHFGLASDIVSTDFYNFYKEKKLLGGSQATLDKCVSNLISWKVSNLEDCLVSASMPISKKLNVAKNIGLGRISIGNQANIVLWDTKRSCVRGTIIGENVFLNY